MSSQRYSIVEPHPSVNSSATYISTGRGGAGNATRPPTSITRGSDASGPASRTFLSSISSNTSSSSRSFAYGRGGAGNIHASAPRMFSFDEELERQMSNEHHVAPVYHVGRGGAGNAQYASPDAVVLGAGVRRTSDGADSSKSTTSVESGADFATRKMKSGFLRAIGRF